MSGTKTLLPEVLVYRVIGILFFCVVSLLLPWWVLILCGFFWVLWRGWITEPLIGGLLHDIVFAIPEDRFFGYLFVETLFVLVAVTAGLYIRHYAR